MLQQLKAAAARLKQETYAVWLVARDPRTPWYAKLVGAAVVAYAVSPIDLIPDFIPVLGLLDDLILLPLGVWLVIRLVPDGVWAECRAAAGEASLKGRTSWVAAAVIVAVWFALAALCAAWLYEAVS